MSKPKIEPAASYRVAMQRPVRAGLAVYRPDQDHVMTGATVLEVLSAAGVAVEQAATVLTFTAVEQP